MQIKNVSESELNEALRILNQYYDNNVIFRRFERLNKDGTRFRVTLRVKDSHGKGAKLSYNPFKSSYRHLPSACWHVHGDFFDILLALNHKTVIETMMSTIYKEHGETKGNWKDRNIGSVIFPFYYSEACECDHEKAIFTLEIHQKPEKVVFT